MSKQIDTKPYKVIVFFRRKTCDHKQMIEFDFDVTEDIEGIPSECPKCGQEINIVFK